MSKLNNNTFILYNPIQADRFIQSGCKIVKIDIHKRTKNIMFVFFKDSKFEEAMFKWNNKNS